MTNPPRILPHTLAGLPTIEAQVQYRIGDGRQFPSLEGCVFDRAGAFYVCDTVPNDTAIIKIAPDGTRSEFYRGENGMIIGLAVHKDGRFFAADMLRNSIRILSPVGVLEREIFPTYQGQALKPDCMAFDPNGNLLFTDLRGTIYEPAGGLYRLMAEDGYKEPELLFDRLAAPNGLSFSPDYRMLWLAETNRNTLSCIQLTEDYTVMRRQYSPIVTYQNVGKPNMDSLRVDALGNVYCGIMFGGRAIVFNSDGIPIANIVVPDFAEHRLQYTPNLVLRSDAAEGFLLASDAQDAYVLRFEAFAPSQPLYSHS